MATRTVPESNFYRPAPTVIPEPNASDWDRFLAPGRPTEYDHDVLAEEEEVAEEISAELTDEDRGRASELLNESLGR